LPSGELPYMTTDAKPSYAARAIFSRQMRSEFILLTVVALLVFLAAIIFPTGHLLDFALHYPGYHLDNLIVGFLAVSFVLMIFLARGWRALRRESSERSQLVTQIEQRAAINAQLSHMTSLLHACFELEEASEIIAHFARHLFPDHTGTLYVFRSSRNLLEVTAAWGESEDQVSMFTPHQCWALRQGQMYEVLDPQHSILCQHIKHPTPYLCLPMMAHGEVLALLHVRPDPSTNRNGTIPGADHILLRSFTEHIALALSNLKLHDMLRQQSLRDSLTGLFNRRYLEETLTVEIERAKRTNGPFSVMMLDLDHFKRFNDTHGHDAGDAALQALGGFLQRQVRGGDIACRYGGEEFTLLLPGASVEMAQQRAEQLCEGVRMLRIDGKGRSLGPLTLSIGIATFPKHGESNEMILQAADVALYQAKTEGRDRAIVAV
jgi:diguanylate cyclase (GGDEF)-like protein